MRIKLSQKEIEKRLIKLRNYERLYPELKKKYEALKKKYRKLKEELERERKERREEAEAFKLRIEQLEKIVFGGKDKDDDGTSGGFWKKNKKKKQRKKRSAESYRRAIPSREEVTEEKHYGIDCCPDCGEPLSDVREVIRYVEDIVIPMLSNLKNVEKQRIETGFCKKCRKRYSQIPISKQVCTLGENIRNRVVYATTILGQTFEKVSCDLRDTFGVNVSDGEIVNILTKQAIELLPEYNAINVRIREGPCKHLDETTHPVQKEGEGQFGWVKTASDTPDTIFRLGRSRGKGVAKELHDKKGQPTVTDDYGAYDQFGEDQALCWAHPKRKFEDLAKSRVLAELHRLHCHKFYKRFCRLFHDVKQIVENPYHHEQRIIEAKKFRKRIMTLCRPNPLDPKKFMTLKNTFGQRVDAYLLCVLRPNVPMTNNKAERALRPLVIKRKLSFGSKTQKGADVMSILMSVCFSLWWRKPDNFFEAYNQIRHKWLQRQ
jgi:transposase